MNAPKRIRKPLLPGDSYNIIVSLVRYNTVGPNQFRPDLLYNDKSHLLTSVKATLR